VEYVWNSDPGVAAGTTYSNSVYYGYGPNGTSIVSVNSTTASGESKTLYTVQFQTPVQAGDQVDVELNDGNGWFNAAQRFSPITNNATSYGILLVAINSTTYRVAFGNAGFNSSNATTYGAVGSSWSSLSGWRWRVRKASAGAAVGFGIVVPGTSAGLVSASGVPGNTTGNAIASGFVGEWIFATPASAVTFGTTGVVFNITSLALTAGTWLVYGNFTINPATATMTASYGGVSTSSTSFDSLTYVVGGQHTTTTNTYYASLPRVIRTTGTTMYLNGNVSYSGTAGTYSTTSSIQAIRIA
jgi:hypothetical protein